VAAPEACPACGARTEPLQEYCLDCGSRIVPGRRLSSLGHAWERRFGRYPGDWLLVSLLLAAVAAGSATAGIVSRRDTGNAGTRTLVATSRVVAAPPTPVAVETAPQPKSKPTTVPAPTTKPANEPATWPNRNGYTVVVASIPARGSGLDDARSKAKAARAARVGDVGILVSSRFASLHPGYYVVFAGVYDSLEEAQTAANRLAGRYPNAYARQISR
jgi:hypothetical protein